MKKMTKNAFTLVEMLIVIVIIGILIASLMPRMQSAQGRARDVARKNDLAQLQTAIITSWQDRGGFPGTPENTGYDAGKNGDDTNKTIEATNGIDIEKIGDNLISAGMSSIPSDPNKNNKFKGVGNDTEGAGGQYRYIVSKKNGVDNGGFVLMAKTEVEGSSNWVYCGEKLESGGISPNTELDKIKLCSTVQYKSGSCVTNEQNCYYDQVEQLRFITVY